MRHCSEVPTSSDPRWPLECSLANGGVAPHRPHRHTRRSSITIKGSPSEVAAVEACRCRQDSGYPERQESTRQSLPAAPGISPPCSWTCQTHHSLNSLCRTMCSTIFSMVIVTGSYIVVFFIYFFYLLHTVLFNINKGKVLSLQKTSTY